MALVYILHSVSLNKFYIGSCNDLASRLQQHTNKEFSDSFTAKANDWIIFFSIDDLNYQQARSIERHIKKMKNTTYIINLKKYRDITLKLIEKYK